MYLNVYVPGLQYESGVAAFFRRHRGHPWASSALMEPISTAFVAAIHAFVDEQKVPLIPFAKGQRKDDEMAERLTRFAAPEGVVFVGRAQEKTPVIRTEKRRNPTTGQAYPWLVLRRRWSTCPSPKPRPAGQRLICRLGPGHKPISMTPLHLLRLLPVLRGGQRQLTLENLALRQQLAVLQANGGPATAAKDGSSLLGLAGQGLAGLRRPLVLVTADPVLRWQRRP